MNKCWKTTKFGLVLFALPLVATAAASAHLQLAQTSPITIESEVVAIEQQTEAIGLDRVHTVALNRSGGVDGRIVSLDENSKADGLSQLNVRFVKDGEIIGQGTTDSDGVFSVQDIPEGVYSFVATGDNGFAAYSVRVVSDAVGKYDDVMEAVAVSNVASVKSIIGEPAQSTAIPSSDEKVAMDENGANRVVLKNGVLTGRVLLPKTGKVENTQVHILSNGISIATVEADENGEFQVPDMKPGVYAFVAVGPQVMAAVAFEAVDFERQVKTLKGSASYVSTTIQEEEIVYTDVLNVYTAYRQDVVDVAAEPMGESVVDDSMPIEYAGESLSYGGACGSCGESACSPCGGAAYGGGGGGGAGGIGALGRAAIIGALTVGIIALADGDGSDPPPASPATP